MIRDKRETMPQRRPSLARTTRARSQSRSRSQRRRLAASPVSDNRASSRTSSNRHHRDRVHDDKKSHRKKDTKRLRSCSHDSDAQTEQKPKKQKKAAQSRPLGLQVSDPSGSAHKLLDVTGVCYLSDNGKFTDTDKEVIAISRIRNGTNKRVLKLTKLNWWEKVTLENLLGSLKRCSAILSFSQASKVFTVQCFNAD